MSDFRSRMYKKSNDMLERELTEANAGVKEAPARPSAQETRPGGQRMCDLSGDEQIKISNVFLNIERITNPKASQFAREMKVKYDAYGDRIYVSEGQKKFLLGINGSLRK